MEKHNSNNLLICDKTEEIKMPLLQIAFELSAKGINVIYITAQPIQEVPILGPFKSDLLKQILFMYTTSVDTLIGGLLDFLTRQSLPQIIILESLHEFFTAEQLSSYETMAETCASIFATLHNTIATFSNNLNEISPHKVYSISSLDIESNDVCKKLLPLWVDLYYYQDNCITAEALIDRLRDFLEF